MPEPLAAASKHTLRMMRVQTGVRMENAWSKYSKPWPNSTISR